MGSLRTDGSGFDGTPVCVTVVSATPTAQIDFNVLMEIDATVHREGEQPYRVQIPLTLSQMQAPFLQPGRTFAATVAPDDRHKIWIDPASVR
jgi:hypothetical protein